MNDNITVKTTNGMTTIARENIAAFTIVGSTTMEIHLKSGTIFTTRDMVVEPLAELILGEASQTNSEAIESLSSSLSEIREATRWNLDDIVNHRDRLDKLEEGFKSYTDEIHHHLIGNHFRHGSIGLCERVSNLEEQIIQHSEE
jgi:hypothetical protein